MVGNKLNYFLGGLGIGALAGVLFAPRSGEESRDYLNQRVEEGKEYAQRKAREIRERAEDVVERGKQIVANQKELISEAVEAGREVYQREKSKEPAYPFTNRFLRSYPMGAGARSTLEKPEG